MRGGACHALAGTVAVWSRLATGDRLASFRFAAWLPVLLVHLLGLRACGLFLFARRAARHRRAVEAVLELPPFLHGESGQGGLPLTRLQVLSGPLFWFALSPLSFALAADRPLVQRPAGRGGGALSPLRRLREEGARSWDPPGVAPSRGSASWAAGFHRGANAW